MSNLGKMGSLEYLDLEWNDDITDHGLQSLYGLGSLRWLDIGFCGLITPNGVASLRLALPLCEMIDAGIGYSLISDYSLILSLCKARLSIGPVMRHGAASDANYGGLPFSPIFPAIGYDTIGYVGRLYLSTIDPCSKQSCRRRPTVESRGTYSPSRRKFV
ncbi:MAG: hypothetical protein JXA73_06135 [Acidobacteria bacterium]|nr:hypothetical protein [Acidobacteriota bacterium]